MKEPSYTNSGTPISLGRLVFHRQCMHNVSAQWWKSQFITNADAALPWACMSSRTQRALSAEGIRYLFELSSLSDIELLRIPNFGRKSLNELRGMGLRP